VSNISSEQREQDGPELTVPFSRLRRECPEAPSEEPSFSSEEFKVLKCNISTTTNEMMSGILDSLNQQLEKYSSTLNRTAVYDEKSRIDRMPAYLTTHFVRFYWRRDINKKTKIMRKVKFPFDLDVTPFLTDDLKAKVLPAKDKIISISKERDERMKIRRKVKARKDNALTATDAARDADPKKVETSTTGGLDAPRPADAMAVDTTTESLATTSSSSTAASAVQQPGGALTDEEELQLRVKERAEAEAAVHEDLRRDIGCNSSGLYELVGIVTHKGAAADAGHYISWVRKDDDRKLEAGAKGKIPESSAVEEWYKVSQ
jgi:ubiquitin carboxyl-terminal hydrolase 14